MNQTPSQKLKQILDDLERELSEIKSAIVNPCTHSPQFNHMRIVFGLGRLNEIQFAPEEFMERIEALRSNFLSTNNKLFGFHDKDYNL